MAEKKKVVIKLKYPNGQLSAPKIAEPKIITEWNYLRIAVALGCLAALGGLVVYFSSSAPQNTAVANVPTVPALPAAAVAPTTEAKVVANAAPTAVSLKKKVRRAQLATKIVDSEPVGKISSPVVAGEKQPVTVYYFAELVDMKGKSVFHEWLLDDKLISKKTVNISDNTWRTSSRQMVAFTTISNWTVRLVDGAGEVLDEQKFTVALKE